MESLNKNLLQLSNIESPGRPQKRHKVVDSIPSLIKKNSFTTYVDKSNTVENADVLLSKPTATRCHHECKFQEVCNKVQSTNIQEQQGQNVITVLESDSLEM